MSTHTDPRSLSFDERLAAEAAFAGRPFNPKWSAAARVVYDGMVRARGTVPTETVDLAQPTELGAGGALSEITPPSLLVTKPAEESSTAQVSLDGTAPSEAMADQNVPVSRERAIEAGALIEVTPLAKSVGVPYAVGITRPAWETVVTASDSVPESAHEGRVRDVLMALRLRLMSGPITRSVIDFPALVTFPPDAVPQPQLLLAAFHDSPESPTCITLLLPRELSLLLQHDQD